MSDLIDRLRNLNQHGFIKYDDLFIGTEAADEIERLQRENEELRKQVNSCKTCPVIDSLKAKQESAEPVAYYAHRIERSLEDTPDEYVSLHRDFLADTAKALRNEAKQESAEPDKFLSELYGLPVYLHPPKQESAEPVAWIYVDETGQRYVDSIRPHKDYQPLYMHPQKQESAEQPVAWLQLSDAEDHIYRPEDATHFPQWQKDELGMFPVWSTPTAAIESFKRRAVEVAKQYEHGSAVKAIESLPLIEEK